MSASMSDDRSFLRGGIDLGGTKIEATLFDVDLTPLVSRRVATPLGYYEELVETLCAEVAWLRAEAKQPDLPVGVGIPGLIDPTTGHSVTANLPANDKPLGADLKKRGGGQIELANDCKCFALSEATGGAGREYRTVFGLILGTGLGGGVVVDGALLPGPNVLAGEIGHAALPAHLVSEFELPILPCGCGRRGCFETYLSGKGLSRLSHALTGTKRSAPEVIEAAQHDTKAARVFDVWQRLAGELLHNLQLHIDPDCIVLGGGLSKIAGIDETLTQALQQSALPGLRNPKICTATFSDSSGTRGAALLVRPPA